MQKLAVHSGSDKSLAPDHHDAVSLNTALLLDVFAELESCDLCYCVLRNFEELPEKAYGDVDILVSKRDLPTVEMIVTRLLAVDQFLFKRLEKNGHTIFDISSKAETIKAIQENRAARVLRLDFVTALQWKGVAYLDSEDVLASRIRYGDFFITVVDHRAVHLLYHALLDKNFFSERYRELLSAYVSDDSNGIVELLRPFTGSEMAKQLYSALANGDYTELLRLRKPVILSLLSNRPVSLLSLIYFYFRKSTRLIEIALIPPGILVATAGPDGAGKSTLLHNIGSVLDEAFEPIREQYMGWKQFILPTKHLLRFLQNSVTGQGDRVNVEGTGTVSAQSGESKQKLSWTHNLSVLHYFVDLWARYLLKIRPVLARGGLVLCDRYFYDVLSRDIWLARNSWTRSLFLALTPQPTLTVLFKGDPQAIAARKQEISPEETARQLESLSVLAQSRGTVVELDAMERLDENVLISLKAIF